MYRCRGVDSARLISKALEQPLCLLEPALRQAQLGELRQRLGVQRGLGPLADLQGGNELGFGLRPFAR